MNAATPPPTTPQHPLTTSVLLHLAPGVVTTLVYVGLAPVAMRLGYPALLALLLAATVGVALQLAWLLVKGRARNGALSLDGVVQYRERRPRSRYWAVVPALVLVAFAVSAVTGPVDQWLTRTALGWLPDWYVLTDLSQFAAYPTATLLVVFGLQIVLNGLVFPVVEELYFHGYLLPRIDRLGRWAPVVNTALFACYHFWQPYALLTIFLSILPMVWVVWRRRDVRIGLLTHCTLNTVGGVLTTALVLGARAGLP